MYNYSYVSERNKRLIDAIDRELPNSPSLAHAVNRVINRPLARGFYIGVDSAITTDRRLRNSPRPAKPSTPRQRQWVDIMAAADRYQREHPGSTRAAAITATVSFATASGFYISPNTAIHIYRHRLGS